MEIGDKKEYTDSESDLFEALSGRFARAADLLFRRVFRSIDMFEFEETGTLIDVLGRAEKRGLLSSIEEARKIRELRNDIVHEYMIEDIQDIYRSLLYCTPLLLMIIEKTRDYVLSRTDTQQA